MKSSECAPISAGIECVGESQSRAACGGGSMSGSKSASTASDLVRDNIQMKFHSNSKSLSWREFDDGTEYEHNSIGAGRAHVIGCENREVRAAHLLDAGAQGSSN